jgi:hypothetical protein
MLNIALPGGRGCLGSAEDAHDMTVRADLDLPSDGDRPHGPARVNDADPFVEGCWNLIGSHIDQRFHPAAIIRMHRLQEGLERQGGGPADAQDFAEAGRYPHEHRTGVDEPMTGKSGTTNSLRPSVADRPRYYDQSLHDWLCMTGRLLN